MSKVTTVPQKFHMYDHPRFRLGFFNIVGLNALGLRKQLQLVAWMEEAFTGKQEASDSCHVESSLGPCNYMDIYKIQAIASQVSSIQ